MQKELYTTKELIVCLSLAKSNVLSKAKRENWQSQARKGRGGGREWLYSSMPEATQLAIRVAVEKSINQACCEVSNDFVDINKIVELDEKRKQKGLLKADILAQYAKWQARHGATVKQKQAFIEAFLAGAWPKLLDDFGTAISWKSLERWKLQERQDGITALAEKRGIACKGKSLLTNEHRSIILGFILDPNKPNIEQCVRKIEARCKAKGIHAPSGATIRRFVNMYTSQTYDEYTLWRNGKKAWNDNCAISILRDWSKVEVGDVVIADGHTLNFETINPDTGKPCRMTMLLFYDGAANCPLGWEVMATENTACISSAFRRTCLALGKIPRVVYIDNGKAFRSKFFKGTHDFEQSGFLGLYRELGCEVIHAWPYHGQSKPIERFFGTMHEMEVFVPSYTGNSIDNKPARMHRGETIHRKLYDKMGGRPLTLEETHYTIAKWFDEYVNRPQPRTHLKGKTPFEILKNGVGPGVDLERLNLLMLQKEIKTITKDGIRHLGKLFWHEALASRRHKVIVRYDNVRDPHNVLVYDEYSRFICEARDREYYKIAYGLHPAARVLGDEFDRQDLSEAIALKKGQERAASANMKYMLENVIAPEVEERNKLLELNKNISAAPKVLDTKNQEISAAEIAEVDAAKERIKAAILNPPKPVMPKFYSEFERYDYLFELKNESGVMLDVLDLEWMANFEQTPVFERNYKRRYDQKLELYNVWKKSKGGNV